MNSDGRVTNRHDNNHTIMFWPIIAGFNESSWVHCRVDSILTWVASREKVPYGLSRCHTKRRTGVRGRARPFLVWHRLFPKKIFQKKSKMSVSYQKKGGRGNVWQRLRTLGTFTHNAAHMTICHGISTFIHLIGDNEFKHWSNSRRMRIIARMR